jgi:tetratricopeptide (TPR) repeat protein
MPDLTRAIELDPENAWAYKYRGEARRKSGDYDGAVSDYSKARELKPELPGLAEGFGEAKKLKTEHRAAEAPDSQPGMRSQTNAPSP